MVAATQCHGHPQSTQGGQEFAPAQHDAAIGCNCRHIGVITRQAVARNSKFAAIFPEIALVQKMSNGNELKFFINYYYAPSFVEYKKQHLFLDTALNPPDYIWSVNDFTENLNVSAVNLGVGIIF